MKQLTPKRRQSAPLLIPRAFLSRDHQVATCVSRSIDTAPATNEAFGTRMGFDRQSRRSRKGFLLLILAIVVLLCLSNCGVTSAGINTWTTAFGTCP